MNKKAAGKQTVNAILFLVAAAGLWAFFAVFLQAQKQTQTPAAAVPAERLSLEEIPPETAFGWDKRLSLSRYERFVYDAEGNRIGEYRYGPDGELDYYKEKTYDEYGSCTREVYEFLTGSQGATERTFRMVYDELGRVTQKTVYEGNAAVYVADYRYEGDNTLCVTSYPDADGGVSSGYGTVRNGDGITLLSYDYGADGEKTAYETAACDGEGRVIRQTTGRGSGDGEPFKELITEWDDDAHASRETMYEPAGHVNAVQYNTFTDDWNQLSGVRYLSGYRGHDASEWNSRLQFTEGYWADYSGDRKLYEFRYAYQEISYYRMFQYDDAGNCVTKVEYDNEDRAHAALVYRCRYDGDGRLSERYTYRIRADIGFTAEDGTETALRFDGDGHLLSVMRKTGDGAIEHEYLFDGDGKLTGQYLWTLDRFWEAEESRADEGEAYVVQPGDSLWGIAEAYYGDGRYCYEIYEANYGSIGPEMNFIPPGMELFLPEIGAPAGEEGR